MNHRALLLLAASCGCIVFCRSATAQQADNFGLIDGSILFVDEESNSRCAAVNTFNADFFIRSCDRRLILLSGDDRETPYVVDAGFSVTHLSGSPAGAIRFATDNDGSILFVDEESNSRCAAVNTFNADFFIRSCDRRLILLSGDDRETPYVVDAGFSVTHLSGTPAGAIRFATDNDGARQVFWLSDDSFAEGADLVLNYISETDTLAVATIAGQEGEQIPLSPINVRSTECDPLASFDGGEELLCPRTCGLGAAGASLTLTLMLGFTAARRGRRRRQT